MMNMDDGHMMLVRDPYYPPAVPSPQGYQGYPTYSSYPQQMDHIPMDPLQESLIQIQHISCAIAELAKAAQMNAGDPTYVMRARAEIAHLSSLLVQYSMVNELRTPKIEGKDSQVMEANGSNKRKHKSTTSQNLYCRSCGTTQTPEWRRGPDGGKSLCNACGLHYAKIIKREVLVPSRKTEGPAEAMNLRTLLN